MDENNKDYLKHNYKNLTAALEIFRKYSVPIGEHTLFSIDGSPLEKIPKEYLEMENNK